MNRAINAGSIPCKTGARVALGAIFGGLRPWQGRGVPAKAGAKDGRTIYRGASGRAYLFEVYPLDDAAALADVEGVYVYARALPSGAAPAQNGNRRDFAFGYVGETVDMGHQHAEHDRLRHFAGHGFDTLLVLRIEQPTIRTEVAHDLVEKHRPVLNDLLRSGQGGENA